MNAREGGREEGGRANDLSGRDQELMTSGDFRLLERFSHPPRKEEGREGRREGGKEGRTNETNKTEGGREGGREGTRTIYRAGSRD